MATAEKLESLMRWMHERPQMYAVLAGELDSILYFLHMVWADLTRRDSEYQAVRSQCYEKSKGLLNDQQRKAPVKLGEPATDLVLEYWNRVDEALNIQVRCDRWHEQK